MSTTPTAFNTQGSKPKLVFVGNGMAGTRTLEELLAIHSEKYEISVIGEENFGNYNRIMLSPVLAGEKTIAACAGVTLSKVQPPYQSSAWSYR